jgi:predicted dehydrogenase
LPPMTLGRARASLRRVANSVSTLPPSSSYVWGLRLSLLAFATFHVIYLVRLLSPLQWLKYALRSWRKYRSPTNHRLDIPASTTEVYFLVALGCLLAAYLGDWGWPGWLGGIGRAAGWILFAESVGWVVYYLVLRTFIERRYTIYDPAEYLLTFPVVLLEQVFLVRLLAGQSLQLVIASYAGNPVLGNQLSVALTALGLVYLTAAISVLISMHPGIPTRPSASLAVIGGGEVTMNRILPALERLQDARYGRNDVLVVTLADELTPARRKVLERRARVAAVDADRVLSELRREVTPTIIASPTAEHLAQIVALSELDVPFAVEKPIVGSPAEREILARDADRLMRKGFALSYYTLEKALPLTYFLSPVPVYRQFLRADRPEILASDELQALRDGLGPLRSVELMLLEGAERSPSTGRTWTEQPATLRTFVETAIHPLLVLRRLIGAAELEWDAPTIGRFVPRVEERGEIAPTFVDAHATALSESARVPVRMVVGKWMPDGQTSRCARVEYARGSLLADFDRTDLEVNVDGRLVERISLRPEFEKYQVLLSLFVQFAAVESGWDGIGIRYDDFEPQLDALAWWDRLCDLVDQNQTPIVGYGADGPPGLLATAAGAVVG